MIIVPVRIMALLVSGSVVGQQSEKGKDLQDGSLGDATRLDPQAERGGKRQGSVGTILSSLFFNTEFWRFVNVQCDQR